jgi:hypothetical protein
MARKQVDQGVLVPAGTTTTQTVGNSTISPSGQDSSIEIGGAQFLNLFFNGTSGAGTVTIQINGWDPASKSYYNILTSAALVGNSGFTRLRVGPLITAVANLVALDYLPKKIQVVATVSGAVAYSIGYSVTG